MNIESSGTSSPKEITIPLEPRTLGEFIANLLGQRRSIDHTFEDRRFEIDMSWLINLDHIVEQRLAAQNAGRLVSFSASFYFANGKIVTLENQFAFRSFRDMTNELAVGIDLKWTYLVHFPLAKLPEKQEIRFVAFTRNEAAERKSDQKPSKSFLSLDSEQERLAYFIHFTDVTWGEDISAHLTSYITSKTEAIPKWKVTLRKIRSAVIFPVAMLLGIFAAVWSFSGTLSVNTDKLIKQYGVLTGIPSRLQDISQKIDFLVDLSITRLLIEIPFVTPLLKVVFVYVLFVASFYVVLVRKASFISINDHSRQYLEKYGKNFEFIKYGIGAGLIIGIIGGVFSNRIYDLMNSWF